MYMSVYINMYIRMYVLVSIYTHIYICILRMCVYTHVYLHAYTYLYVYIYIYAFRTKVGTSYYVLGALRVVHLSTARPEICHGLGSAQELSLVRVLFKHSFSYQDHHFCRIPMNSI